MTLVYFLNGNHENVTGINTLTITAFSASAATKPRLLYNVIPDLSTPSGAPVRDYLKDPIMVPELDQRRAARR